MVLQPGKAMEAAERGLVSIVKTSTMVLQPPTHLHVPGGSIVSIVKESAMVLQRPQSVAPARDRTFQL